MTTRHRALQRPLDKIEHLRHEERGLLDADIAAADVPRAERGRERAIATAARFGSVRRRDAGDGAGRRAARADARAWPAFRSGSTSGSSTRRPTRRPRPSATSWSAGSTTSPRRRKAAAGADVVTYEWEGVPADDRAARWRRDAPVRPSPRALEVSQDRLVEKDTVPVARASRTAPFRAVDDRDVARRRGRRARAPRRARRPGAAATTARARPCCASAADVDAAWDAARRRAAASSRRSCRSSASCRSSRCAAPTARSRAGRSSRTRTSTASCASPARRRPGSTPRSQARAEACIRPLLESLDYVGVGCVELFDVDGELLANEMAPRVHNCGHWTIEGADTSQFENHLRAVLGWPLGSTAARGVERDGQLHRRHARPRRRARDPGRAPARLRQGAAARPQGRPRHRHRGRRRPRSTLRSRACRRSSTRRPTADRAPRSGDRAGLAELGRPRRRRSPSRPAPRRCAGPATAPSAAPRPSCARSAARARAAARRRVR